MVKLNFKGGIMTKRIFIACLIAISPMAQACDWGGIPEVRSRSHQQAVAMCKLIPTCLEKFDANEQCKKDWYEERRKGRNAPRQRRGPIPEYEQFSEKMKSIEIPYKNRSGA